MILTQNSKILCNRQKQKQYPLVFRFFDLDKKFIRYGQNIKFKPITFDTPNADMKHLDVLVIGINTSIEPALKMSEQII